MTGPRVSTKQYPLWRRIKLAASDLRPCVVSHGSGVIKALADEVKQLEEQLAALKRGRTKKQHEALCSALVILRETAARKGLTHADKDKALEQAAEALERAL